MKKYWNLIFLAMIFLATILFNDKGITVIKSITASAKVNPKKIVIDPGHGGIDPGKVGINNALEKDINLAISLKLKAILEKKGYEIVMTRTTDTGLYSEKDQKKKSADLRKRVEVVNSSNAVLAVSIHQNSFTQESSKGAQVFYHNESEEGKVLAESIQEQIKLTMADSNHRIAKSNTTYYMLKKTVCPIVIVECGFLSNATEAELLLEDKYQEKMATGIAKGILIYLQQK